MAKKVTLRDVNNIYQVGTPSGVLRFSEETPEYEVSDTLGEYLKTIQDYRSDFTFIVADVPVIKAPEAKVKEVEVKEAEIPEEVKEKLVTKGIKKVIKTAIDRGTSPEE